MNRSMRPVLTLLVAEILSVSGTRLSMIAIPWLVLNLAGDPMMAGVAAFAEMLPYVVSKGLGGPLIDRLGARFIAISGELLSVVVLAVIPALHVIGMLHVNALLPVVFLMGLLRGPTDAAKQALVPVVAEAADAPLERITGMMATVERLAGTLGAAVAGVLVALIGAAPALAVNALAFGLAALTVTLGIAKRQQTEPQATAGYMRDLKEGWRFLTKDAVLVGFVVMIALTNLLDQALLTVLVPVWAMEYGGGPSAIGTLIAVQSAFAVLGAAVATRYAERMPRLKIYAIAFLTGGAPRFLILLPGLPFTAILAILAVAGFAIGFINPIISAVSFERMPKALVGRVSSLMSALAWALAPFGGLIGGAAVAYLGLPISVAFAAALYFAVTMAPLFASSFRALSIRPKPVSAQKQVETSELGSQLSEHH
ncbi:MFS transporter [Yoonia sp. R2-816]|uniref:MFS transporter n=1 Tax=Yoonia sp. R2-816 TaxID=3342638 RepID=UPI00372C9D7C